MRHLPVATLLQNLQEPQDVGRNVGIRPFEGIAYPGLRRQVNHTVELTTVEQLIHRLRVRERCPNELEAPILLQQREPRLLEAYVIVLVHGVEADDFVMISEKSTCHVEADEAGCTCH